ncbi:MAG TPA: M13 family metallopeptidase, partial [Steroidobacteraceae bacterium]|nr:M13 family metallopeptidase [Steroidobacteraceae bacterium]
VRTQLKEILETAARDTAAHDTATHNTPAHDTTAHNTTAHAATGHDSAPPKGAPEQLIGDFYGACMDESAVNKAGLQPLEPLLQQIAAIRTRADLQGAIDHLQSMGVRAPFNVRAEPDYHDPAMTLAELRASGLGLPDRDYYLKTEARFGEARRKYRAHVAHMFALAGVADEQAREAAGTVFRMEKQLAAASLDNVALRDPQATDHRMSVAELQKLAPALDWTRYFAEAGIASTAPNVEEPKFLRAVDQLLRDAPIADWQVYLRWQLLHTFAEALPAAFAQENYAFYDAYLAGTPQRKPRWKYCTQQVDDLLGDALGRKYVEKHFSSEAKRQAQILVRNIVAAMHDTLATVSWMSAETRREAQAKLASLDLKIGYPDKWKDYAGLDVSRGSHERNVIAATAWNVKDEWGLIGKPTDRRRWEMTPPTSDAYYNPGRNEIVFPAGILQPPGFDPKAVDAANYGAIGIVIGHEISHGFDDEGARFDATGRLRNWWQPQDLARFQEKTACVARQFDGYFIEPGIHHNGRLVLGESIADLAGAKLAYLAFQKARKQRPSPVVNGFTPDQQFFIAWGQWRGDEIRPETQRLMVQSDPHPVAQFRVIGPLSNLPQFSAAFGCKEGEPMSRPLADRCEVW